MSAPMIQAKPLMAAGHGVHRSGVHTAEMENAAATANETRALVLQPFGKW